MLNPWLLLGGVVAWGASLAGAAWLGKDYADGQHAKQLVREQALIAEVREANREFADQVVLETARAISEIRVEHKTINKEVRHEREIHTRVLDNPDCAVPASTVKLRNRAAGYAAEGAGTGGNAARVPEAAEAGR